jgi:hypothetical protein
MSVRSFVVVYELLHVCACVWRLCVLYVVCSYVCARVYTCACVDVSEYVSSCSFAHPLHAHTRAQKGSVTFYDSVVVVSTQWL